MFQITKFLSFHSRQGIKLLRHKRLVFLKEYGKRKQHIIKDTNGHKIRNQKKTIDMLTENKETIIFS